MTDLNNVKNAILNLVDYNNQKTIKENNALNDLKLLENDCLFVSIIMNKENKENLNKFKKDLTKLVKIDYGFSGIKFEFISFSETKTFRKYILIESGKGGVGKSTVCANLAYSFSRLGKKVGIIDADIYGPSIPNILNEPNKTIHGTEDGKIYPALKDDIEYISTSYFTDGSPLMWRGPLLSKMLNHFVNDTLWDDEIEYMFVDLPPGTGDVMIDLKGLIPNSNVIIVTTPNFNASDIAIKAGVGAINLEQNILGVIENMSYFVNPVNKNKEYIFGSNGGLEVASKLGTSLLGQIPVTVNNNGIYEENTDAGKIYLEISKNILELIKNK